MRKLIAGNKAIALRMERQHLARRTDLAEYMGLCRDTQPGQNVYWNGFGDPPSLTCRADFDDIAFNREWQRARALMKGRFTGGNIGWVAPEVEDVMLDLPAEEALVRKEKFCKRSMFCAGKTIQ